MTDIYDIKPLLLNPPINVTYSLIFLVVFIVLYFLLFYKKEEKKVIVLNNKKSEKIDVNDILKDLEQNIEKHSKDEFYHKLDKAIRIYLKNTKNIDIDNLSFKEIEQLDLDDDLKSYLKEVYYKEYDNRKDDLETRKRDLKTIQSKWIVN